MADSGVTFPSPRSEEASPSEMSLSEEFLRTRDQRREFLAQREGGGEVMEGEVRVEGGEFLSSEEEFLKRN